ncbi:MAG: beta-N-acetylhexosaminidase [Gaiellaceae bacterium]|jgi:beta-N-acetylhexosaminidase|nr:beta-N-acetylhexosaminidase [Gaiellaceae bacterium]
MTALAQYPRESFLAQVRSGEVGGVILVGRWASTAQMAAVVRTLQAAACEHGSPLLIAVDQEGGPTRRMPWAAPAESAWALGSASPSHVRTEAQAAAAALRRAGVSIDFAPVTDTRLSPANFLGSRVFSSDPAVVGRLSAAFVSGLQAGGVAATAKHFPGLGAALQNTDDHRVSVQLVRLQPFRDAIAAGVQLVMMSNASYPHLDASGTPAVFSHKIVTDLLRNSLGFGGVVVTDALDAPTPNATPHAPARAMQAGVDLLLYTSGAAATHGYESLLADASRSAPLRAQIAAAAARISALKDWLGASCGAP